MEMLTKSTFDKEVLETKGTVLVDFFANWCGPCKMLSPVLEEIANENEDIKICKVDVDHNEELSRKYGVMSIPALLVFKDGELITKTVGYRSKEEVLELVK